MWLSSSFRHLMILQTVKEVSVMNHEAELCHSALDHARKL